MDAQTYPAHLMHYPGRSVRASLMRDGQFPRPDKAADEFSTGMRMLPRLPIERTLARHEMMDLPAEDFTLLCQDGELWLTRYGDFEDYFLGRGESCSVRRGDGVAVQALKPSRVRLVAA